MSLCLQVSRHLLRRGAVSSLISPNACRTLVCTTPNKAKLGTAPQPVTSGLLPSYHWTIERVVAVSMLPMYPIALQFEPYLMEYVVAAAVSLHAYWGFGGVIRDYAIERKYGPLVPKALQLIWKILCAFGFAGFTYFNYYDIGVIKGVKKLWSF
ncbi:unnamed protein product [Mesocestoides corti]|uniref:Succinate dehydrogenase [ubiquinone] cytochrome b small subunit n=1 Tax=Mesocestoides corti TaxID=53468 RepID=A0A0R3U4G4_MESCO|nr:unnamed protein product [Mesocestoides corti]